MSSEGLLTRGESLYGVRDFAGVYRPERASHYEHRINEGRILNFSREPGCSCHGCHPQICLLFVLPAALREHWEWANPERGTAMCEHRRSTGSKRKLVRGFQRLSFSKDFLRASDIWLLPQLRPKSLPDLCQSHDIQADSRKDPHLEVSAVSIWSLPKRRNLILKFVHC